MNQVLWELHDAVSKCFGHGQLLRGPVQMAGVFISPPAVQPMAPTGGADRTSHRLRTTQRATFAPEGVSLQLKMPHSLGADVHATNPLRTKAHALLPFPNPLYPSCALSKPPYSLGPSLFCDTGGGGGGEILEEAGTFSGQALLLSYPYRRGGGGQSRRQAPTHRLVHL